MDEKEKVDANLMRMKASFSMGPLTYEIDFNQYDIQVMFASVALIQALLAKEEEKTYTILKHIKGQVTPARFNQLVDKVNSYNAWVVANGKNVVHVKTDEANAKFKF